MYHLVASHSAEFPAEAVGVGCSTVQFDGRPHLGESGLFENLVGIERSIPLRQVKHVGEKCSTWSQGEIDLCIIQFAISPDITVGAVLNNLGHGSGASDVHFDRRKQTFVQELAPGL